MLAVLFALCSAVLFGGMSVAVRWGQAKAMDLEAGVVAVGTVGSVSLLVFTLAAGHHDFDPGQLWPYAATGLAVPGLSQFVFQRSIREAGASRPTMVIGAAPLASVAIALVFLDEPLRWSLPVGTVLIVGGTILLATESRRPQEVRMIGLVLAGVCAVLFATRDNVLRVAANHVDAPALEAGTASLVAGTLGCWVLLFALRRQNMVRRARSALPAMLPTGLCFGGAYALLVAALSQGRVSVVAPLNATQSLWALAFASVLFGRSERIGIRLVVAAAFIVAGAALIGATR